MTKNKVLLITANFPFSPGEEFILNEIPYWDQCKTVELTILPTGTTPTLRDLPPSIKLDHSLEKSFSIRSKLRSLAELFFSATFYRELFEARVSTLRWSLSSTINYLSLRRILNRYLRTQDLTNTVIYTYWHAEASYALQSLKKKHSFKLVTRIHGYDLYQHRRPGSHMPLKSQFTHHLDVIHTIANHAGPYLEKTYGFDKRLITISRLGVPALGICTAPTSSGLYNIVSCANLIPVKRIDKLIAALALLPKKLTNGPLKVTWTHIGAGTLREELETLARKTLGEIEGVDFCFTGLLSNAEIFAFYRDTPIDIFVNTSESEGVPVSIMEALSCSIPAIAPNVGGIKEMVQSDHNGSLLTSNPDPDEISDALARVSLYKHPKTRENAYAVFEKNYDASINYPLFIQEITGLLSNETSP